MIDDKGLSVLNEELTEQYVYVRSIKEFFEYKTHMFVDKEGLNDSWHTTQKQDKISTQLLKSASLPKTTDYICHPKLKPGVVDISPRELVLHLGNTSTPTNQLILKLKTLTREK